MSNDPFKPNKNGMVVVTMKSAYGSNVSGEKCGFLPAVAKGLADKGFATVPGYTPKNAKNAKAEKPEAAKSEAGGAELTSRKFRPEKPAGNDAQGGNDGAGGSENIDDLRSEYKAVTGEDADQRWGDERLQKEVEAAKRAKANA